MVAGIHDIFPSHIFVFPWSLSSIPHLSGHFSTAITHNIASSIPNNWFPHIVPQRRAAHCFFPPQFPHIVPQHRAAHYFFPPQFPHIVPQHRAAHCFFPPQFPSFVPQHRAAGSVVLWLAVAPAGHHDSAGHRSGSTRTCYPGWATMDLIPTPRAAIWKKLLQQLSDKGLQMEAVICLQGRSNL